MPVLRKLDPSEVKEVEKKAVGVRKVIAQEYDAIVAQFATGEYAEITLDAGETKITVRNRLNAAMKRLGIVADWKRGKANTLKFKVVSSPFGADPEPVTEPVETVEEVEAPVEPVKAKRVRNRKPAVSVATV